MRDCANGFGLVALASLLECEEARAAVPPSANPLAPKKPHFAPRAKRIIFVFMHGGPSQVDTFDPKPLLIRDHGKPFPGEKPRVQFAATGNLLKSPWSSKTTGEAAHRSSICFPKSA